MRVATWNCERGRRSRAVEVAQTRVIAALEADVVVLTEPPTSLSRCGPGRVASPQRRPGPNGPESWVVITGRNVVALRELAYERLACGALFEGAEPRVAVYGSVLPWLGICHHAPEMVQGAESSFDVFKRVLAEQVDDIRCLQRRYGRVIWAGDFNQSLVGPVRGGSGARRELLREALGSLSLNAWNAASPHAQPDLCAIDLICGPTSLTPSTVRHFEPFSDDVTLSDHAGYAVDIADVSR